MSIPARSSIPVLLAKAFCMSTTISADFWKSTSIGSGRALSLGIHLLLSREEPLVDPRPPPAGELLFVQKAILIVTPLGKRKAPFAIYTDHGHVAGEDQPVLFPSG